MTPLDALCRVPVHELPDAARARVLNRLADTELFVALSAEPAGDKVTLRLFDLGAAQMAVAADLEERLGIIRQAVAYAAVPGRALAAMLGPATGPWSIPAIRPRCCSTTAAGWRRRLMPRPKNRQQRRVCR